MSCGEIDDAAFVITLKESHTCPICLGCIRQPQHIIECGHIFCKKCLDEVKITTETEEKPFVCPLDNGIIKEGQIFTDRRFEREIEDLEVYCRNKSQGCEAVCELRYYQDHIVNCGYNMVSCPLECGEMMMDLAVKKHQSDECRRRQSSCVVCDQEMEDHILKDEHDSVCPMKKLTCDYCRTTVVLRIELEDHYNTVCVSYPTFCMFAPLGCTEKIKRQDLESHHLISTQKHLKGKKNEEAEEVVTVFEKVKKNEMENKNLLEEIKKLKEEKKTENKNLLEEIKKLKEEKKSENNNLLEEINEIKEEIKMEHNNLLEEINEIKEEEKMEHNNLQREIDDLQDEARVENEELRKEIDGIRNLVDCKVKSEV